MLQIKKFYNRFHTERLNGNIQFIWIPPHLGIVGNEKSDELAKKGTQKEMLNFSEVPYTDLFEILRTSMLSQTKLTIEDQSKIKVIEYFGVYYNSCAKPWFHKYNLPRKIITTVNRARSGHYHLKESIAKIKVIDSPTCESGKLPQNLNHILWPCDLFDIQRSIFLRKLRKIKMYPPLSIVVIITSPSIKSCMYMCDFIEDTCKNNYLHHYLLTVKAEIT